MSKNMVNIPSTVEDPSYRYKMPKIQTRIEGKGNGIKVNLVNLEDVAKALRVPVQYILKFMGYEMGSQTIFKRNGNEVTTIINGSFKDDLIIECLDRFINKYVVCANCTYPELKMTIKKDIVMGSCAACGKSNELDNKNRLADFIKKNPPNDLTDFKNQKKTVTNQQAIEQQIIDQSKNFNSQQDYMISELRNIYNQIAEDIEVFDEENDDDFEQLLDYLKSKNQEIPTKSQASFIFFSAIFEQLNESTISKNAYFLKKFGESVDFSDEKSQSYTLVNLQEFLLEGKIQEPQKYIATFLKFFYDYDIFEENFLIDWSDNELRNHLVKHKYYKRSNNKIFLNNSQQLIDWLKD